MFEDDDRFHGNARRDLTEDLDAIDFACAMKDFKSTQKQITIVFIVIWAVLNRYDPTKNEWNYLRKTIGQSLKESEPRFLESLKIAIREIKSSWVI